MGIILRSHEQENDKLTTLQLNCLLMVRIRDLVILFTTEYILDSSGCNQPSSFEARNKTTYFYQPSQRVLKLNRAGKTVST